MSDDGLRVVSPEEFLKMRATEARDAEAARQLEKAQALARFKDALARAVGRVFPDATEAQRTGLAVNIFLCLDDVGIGLYVKEPGE